MAQRVYIQSIKNPACKYYLKSFNPETKTGILNSRYGSTFEVTPFTKERLDKDGYTLHTEEIADAPQA